MKFIDRLFTEILFSRRFIRKSGYKLEKLFNNIILAPLVSSFFGIKLISVSKELYLIESFGYRLLIPKDSLLLAIKILKQNAYEEVYKLSDGDVGAHVGIFSIKAASEVRRGVVIAVEPEPRNYALLQYNIKLNNLESIIIAINKACGNYHGKTTLYLAQNSRSYSINRPWFKTTIEVEVNTLDDIMKSLELEEVNFLKIDVEGSELEVLKGARETIKQSKNLKLALEVHIGQVNFQKVCEALFDLGLYIRYVNKDLISRPVIYAEKTFHR
jgi:FkbM family methyltransferase